MSEAEKRPDLEAERRPDRRPERSVQLHGSFFFPRVEISNYEIREGKCKGG